MRKIILGVLLAASAAFANTSLISKSLELKVSGGHHVLASTALSQPRVRMDFDFDWKFYAGEMPGAEQVGFSDAEWRVLDVPHDWSIEGEYAADHPSGGRCGYLPTGVVWYRKAFELPAAWNGKQVSIEFDSVYMDSTVWLNGVKLGERPYGYLTFAYDLTPHLLPGKNLLVVRADNTEQPSGRWYTGTGILGHVDLLATEAVHIKRGGLFFQTLAADEKSALIQVETEVVGDAEAVVTHQLIAADGQVAAESSGAQLQQFRVEKPLRWSVDQPHLYMLRTTVKSKGLPVDQIDTQVGIRTLRFDNKTGFYLNDVPLKMKGVCEHHDGGPVGGAFPEKILRERLELLKQMGCNAIRTAHNPRTQEFYRLCNELGIMVMDEIFDGWHRKAEADYGGRFFEDWWKKDVEEWLRADRNHPCIVMYSVGNETGREDTYDITGFIKQFDATRPTTGGTVFKGVDIQGYNGPGGMAGSMQKFHEQFPDQICVRTEVPHTLQTRGFYRVRTWWRDKPKKKKQRNEIPDYGTEQIFFDGHPRYSSSYDNCGVRISARTSWRETRDMPWIIGEFRWTGFDYIGEAAFCGGEWPARIWNFGIIDLAGLPKDHYWFYQSQWTEEPMVHILPHWTHRFLKPGTVVPVVAYSNCDEVELFLNGKSLGRQEESAEWLEFVWQVPYAAGELKAVGYKDGAAVAEKVWKTAGAPVELRLETNHEDLKADRLDTATLTFQAVDAQGNNVPWTMNRVHFKIEGPVKNLGFENGDPVDVNPHRVDYRNLFYGYGRGFFQATDDPAPVQITAAALLGDTLFEMSEQVAVDVQRIMLRGRAPNADLQIFYRIDDGKEQRYSAPFVLDRSATVTVVIRRDGAELLRFSQAFEKGVKPKISDPRWKKRAQGGDWNLTKNGFAGPHDPELIGRWKSDRQLLDVRADGKVFVESAFRGYWCYDWPNDAFEAGADDAGTGQIHWVGSGSTVGLQIENQQNRRLIITAPNGRARIYERLESAGLRMMKNNGVK